MEVDMGSQKGSALITGASVGIGATYADRLARRGYDLILVARDAKKLEALASKLQAEAGVKAEALPADLTKKADLARVEARFASDPSITLFLNNAGMAGPNKLLGADLDALETVVQLNVTAATRLAAAAANAFAARNNGTIINLASVVALAPEYFGSAYGASKAYVLHLSQSMQTELAGTNVKVQAVLPGATRTEIWERAGIPIEHLDPNILMDVTEMVDASLAGLDQGEPITIPSLPNPADWGALNAARGHLGPNLSRKHAAERYKVKASNAA
jgi:short-subunit dehydrogenase